MLSLTASLAHQGKVLFTYFSFFTKNLSPTSHLHPKKKKKKGEKKEGERICIARIQNLIMGCEERRGKEEKKRKDDEQLMKEMANWQIAGDHQAHRGH